MPLISARILLTHRTDVAGKTGEFLGNITDLVMDSHGRISLAILTAGEEMTGREIAMPYDALSFAEGARHYVLNVSRDKLASAPTFEKSMLKDPRRVEEIYTFFGVQPYWTEE